MQGRNVKGDGILLSAGKWGIWERNEISKCVIDVLCEWSCFLFVVHLWCNFWYMLCNLAMLLVGFAGLVMKMYGNYAVLYNACKVLHFGFLRVYILWKLLISAINSLCCILEQIPTYTNCFWLYPDNSFGALKMK